MQVLQVISAQAMNTRSPFAEAVLHSVDLLGPNVKHLKIVLHKVEIPVGMGILAAVLLY